MEIRVGRSLLLPPLEDRGERRRQLQQAQVDEIMLSIAELLPPEYRGVYGEQFHCDKTQDDQNPA